MAASMNVEVTIGAPNVRLVRKLFVSGMIGGVLSIASSLKTHPATRLSILLLPPAPSTKFP